MILFVKNIIKFFLIFFSCIIVVFALSNYLINKNAKFKLNKNIDSIILGNSQPECAFNDSLIDNFKNLSKSAETYFYLYPKLKNILKQNQQVKFVFIEFNPTNILEREDQKIWKEKFINYSLPTYNTFLNFKQHKLLILKNPTGYLQTNLLSKRNNIKRIYLNNYNFINDIGGYRYLKGNKINKDPNSIDINKNKQYLLENINLSKYDLSYLDKIIKLCEENKLTIYLIRSPYHKRFAVNLYESVFQQVKQERYHDIPFLDFKDFQLEDDDFRDLQHLNYKGARKFSLWFQNKISDSLKKTKNK
jgi:hypothetical protein